MVSGWLLTRLTPEVLQRISLSTVGGLGWLLGNAGAAVALSALAISQGDRTSFTWGGITLIHVRWAVLVVSTGWELSLLSVLLVAKTSRYWLRTK